MISRLVGQSISTSKKSVLLLGPRQVGKSTLIKSFKPDLTVNFADESTFLEYSTHPGLLRDQLERRKIRTIFIDEVQRLPSILNTIQALIDDDKSLRFFLTGSSARKLKRGGANLLPGRVINFSMGPLTCRELNYQYDLARALKFGFLPEVVTTSDPVDREEILMSYAAGYLKEEVQAEALTKSLEAFARFLSEVVFVTGQFVDMTKLASRAKISRHTCPNYFEILEDTLIGYRIFPDRDLVERVDLVKHPKFFLFDAGVYNGLVKNFTLSPERVGVLSEQTVFSQILHSAQALRRKVEISSFRTRGGLEVDFLVKLDDRFFGIEVKHSDNLTLSDVASLEAAGKRIPRYEPMLIHMGRKELRLGKTWALPLPLALKEMGL